MNHYKPNTSLNLRLSPGKRQMINLEDEFVASRARCEEFYSSQALGGHQNAQKLERTLAKKTHEFSSAVRPHSGPIRVSELVFVGRFEKRDVIGYGSREYIDDCKGQRVRVRVRDRDRDQDEISQLDLSLRL